MAPTPQVSGYPMFHASTGDSYGIPHRNVPLHDQTRPLHSRQHGSSNGASTPQARLLNVDEALQFSPLSSIVPFHSGMQQCMNFRSIDTDNRHTTRYNTGSDRQLFSPSSIISYYIRAASCPTNIGFTRQRYSKNKGSIQSCTKNPERPQAVHEKRRYH